MKKEKINTSIETDTIKKSHYKFSQNIKCEYFPCHKTDEKENLNCLLMKIIKNITTTIIFKSNKISPHFI